MDMDDRPVSRDRPIDAVQSEDLDRYSLSELLERVDRLEAEIARTRAVHHKKSKSQMAAHALFGKGGADPA